MTQRGPMLRRAGWVDDLPQGCLLLAPLACLALMPLAVAVVLLLAARVLGTRASVALIVAIGGGVLLFASGPEAAWSRYRHEALLWQLARARFAGRSLSDALPLSIPAGALLAAAATLWEEAQRPFWVERRPGSTPAARLRERRERRALRRSGSPLGDRVALGLGEQRRVVSLAGEELGQHTLIVGATGAGKTTTLLQILQTLIAQEVGVAVVDLKADPLLSASLEAAARRHARPFEIWTLDGPSFWNPLQRGSATELTDKLFALEEWSEPHYKRAAQRYLHTVLSVLTRSDRCPTLALVVELLDPQALIAFLTSDPLAINPSERDRIELYAEHLDRSSLSAVQGLANRLAFLAETTSGRFLIPSPHGIDLGRTLGEGRVTLFSLDAQAYGETAGHLAGLVALDLRTVLAERLRAIGTGVEVPRAYAAFDEFSAMRSEHLLHLFARGRAAGLGVLLATQELADLTRIDPGFADQVLANTNVKLIHRQDVPESAERLAALAGTKDVYEETLQTERSPLLHVGGRLVGGGRGRNTGRGSIRSVEQFVVHPNLLQQLERGKAVLIRKHPEVRTELVQVMPPTAGA